MSNQYDVNSGIDMKSIHQKDIAEFREYMEPLLKKYPRYDTDYALLRWLRGCKFDRGENYQNSLFLKSNLLNSLLFEVLFLMAMLIN